MKTITILLAGLLIFNNSKTLKIENFFIYHTLSDVYLEGKSLPNFEIEKDIKKFIRSGSKKKHRPEEFYNFKTKSKKDFTFYLSILPVHFTTLESINETFEMVSSFTEGSSLKVYKMGGNYAFVKEVFIPNDRTYFFVQNINKSTPKNKIIEYSLWWESVVIKDYKDKF